MGLEELVHVFVDIFLSVSPEQRARYMSEDTGRIDEATAAADDGKMRNVRA
jgi:hypothetical protein